VSAEPRGPLVARRAHRLAAPTVQSGRSRRTGEFSHMTLVDDEFRMFVGELVVVLLVDGDTLHVDRIRGR
jgi:hypothetical protein